MRYICQVCGYVYDEEAEGVLFSDLPQSWTCPMCKAPLSMFAPVETEEKATIQEEPVSFDGDMQKLSAGALAALFSNLARGSEKQYMEKEAGLFRKIADYFTLVSANENPDSSELLSISNGNIEKGYPDAKAVAAKHGDRGALRACTWGEKVERIVKAVVEKYLSEGEDFLADTEVWVCSICGFVYVGNEPPVICPVCKVPDWKFERIV